MNDLRDTVLEVKDALERALEDQEVFIHLNGEAEGVSLPETLAGNSNVTLKLSYHYRGPLTISDSLVSADLLFPEGAHTCEVPIEHIWGITRISGESMFWPEHAPRQVLEEMIRGVAGEADEEGEEPASDEPEKPKTNLQEIKGDGAKKAGSEEKKPPVLKRIK